MDIKGPFTDAGSVKDEEDQSAIAAGATDRLDGQPRARRVIESATELVLSTVAVRKGTQSTEGFEPRCIPL